MAAGPATVLSGITLTATEVQSGYTPGSGGPDVTGQLNGAILDLQAAALKLAQINAVITAGSNKTAIAAQLTLLNATS